LRDATELLSIAGTRTVIEGADAWNPVFDVTPAELIDAIVTERRVILKPDEEQMRILFP
jgi:methylthioribose-1-phosphate isomerase